jgi:hypothetical protein
LSTIFLGLKEWKRCGNGLGPGFSITALVEAGILFKMFLQKVSGI